jgi:hypothetical protein
MPAREDGFRAGAMPCPTAIAKQKKVRSNRNLGDSKKTNGRRDPDNHDSLGEESAQIPIRATLIGSNRCEALGAVGRGYAPVFALCRALIAAGHDPRRPLHAYRGDVLALSVSSIGEGAQLTVEDDRHGRPRVRRWRERSKRYGAASPVRKKLGPEDTSQPLVRRTDEVVP